MNNVLKVVIVEDEKMGRDNLTFVLNRYFPFIEILGYADDVTDAVEKIEALKPNLVFMDVNLKTGTSFDVLDRLLYLDFKIFFLTAYDSFAIQAIKYRAFDYLLKPIDIKELRLAIDEVLNQFNTEKKVVTAELDNKMEDKISLPTHEGLVLKNICDIIRCEANGNYTIFFFNDASKLIISKTLKDFDESLTRNGFYRIHKSHLVNLSYIEKYINGEGGFIILKNGYTLPVSRRAKAGFIKILSV